MYFKADFLNPLEREEHREFVRWLESYDFSSFHRKVWNEVIKQKKYGKYSEECYQAPNPEYKIHVKGGY